jgi:hypothetical protein
MVRHIPFSCWFLPTRISLITCSAGLYYVGPTTCVAGTTCVYFNAYYSQVCPRIDGFKIIRGVRRLVTNYVLVLNMRMNNLGAGICYGGALEVARLLTLRF